MDGIKRMGEKGSVPIRRLSDREILLCQLLRGVRTAQILWADAGDFRQLRVLREERPSKNASGMGIAAQIAAAAHGGSGQAEVFPFTDPTKAEPVHMEFCPACLLQSEKNVVK